MRRGLLGSVAETFLPFDLSLARAELARIYEGLPAGSADGALLAALRTEYNTVAANTSTGLIVSGTSANGFSTTFSLPGLAGSSPQARQLMLAHLHELANALTIQNPGTDATLYADMLANLEPCLDYQNDYSTLRY